MKPQQLAALINVEPATLRRWAREEFAEFLSPAARGGSAMHRSFDERDVRVMAWVARMRLNNEPFEAIADTLRSAQAANWRDLPPLPDGAQDVRPEMMPVDTALAKVEAAQAEYKAEVKALMRERDILLDQLNRSETENARLRVKNDELVAQVMELNKRLMTLLERQQKRK